VDTSTVGDHSHITPRGAAGRLMATVFACMPGQRLERAFTNIKRDLFAIVAVFIVVVNQKAMFSCEPGVPIGGDFFTSFKERLGRSASHMTQVV
jgi:hypothetical protein